MIHAPPRRLVAGRKHQRQNLRLRHREGNISHCVDERGKTCLQRGGEATIPALNLPEGLDYFIDQIEEMAMRFLLAFLL